MICSNCGTANEAGRKFCKECASGLAVSCPTCGAANAPDAKFCGECASPLAAATATPAKTPAFVPAVPQAERRLVSVLFADLVGFTPFAEEKDAEEVRNMLTRYFDVASDVITRYGGTVEKFIGDAVMAVWGAPTAHEDDAERAVRAGLDLVDAVRGLGPTIQARAAVLTGEAAVTIGATNQGLVAGDLVNTTARLQSAAPPGSVLVGEATYRAASRAIAFEEAGAQALKGKSAPVPAWRALRVVAEVGGKNRSEGLEAPFVGRDDELRLLKDLFLATGREKRIRLVSVMGPAGIGKSRLAWEFLKYVDGLVEDTWWHSGRSPAYGEGISFWALGEMVRGRCGLVETDDETTTRAKVGAAVREWITDEAEQHWVQPALLTLLGIESDVGSEQLFAAWRTFFERIAARAPVVMVFEDLHFADSGTLDFIDHLLEWSKGLPITVVTLARPELLEKRPDWGAGKRNFTSIYLEPLPAAAMRELLAGLIPGLPERAAKAIVERADGIPLYAVETVRMLLADGRLKEEAGVYTPVGDLTALAVPQTLTALIAARLDGLDPADRTLVQVGSVLGQSFTVAGLAAVSGTQERDLEPRLRALVRGELLTQDADPRSSERGQYVFVQALIREVAYHTLAKSDRKARHLAAARFFEQLGSDELAGALAGHYLAAHANAPAGPEADTLAAQARIALKAAADRAVALGAHEQAVAFLEQALTVTDDLKEQGEILERAGDSATIAAGYERAEALLRRSVEIHRQRGDRIGAARATSALGRTLGAGSKGEAALALLEPASAEFADLAPDPVVVELDGRLAAALAADGADYHKALEILERVLEAAEHRDLVAVLARALNTKGAALCELGRLREGIGIIRASEELARESELTGIQLRAIVSRTYYVQETDLAGSLTGMHAGLALARRVGERSFMLRLMSNIGYTAFVAGDWDGGLAMLDAGLAEEVEGFHRMALLSNALVIRACRGESVAEGLAELERATVGETDSGPMVSLLDPRANAALADGRLRDARAAWLHIPELVASLAPISLYQAARAALWDRDLEAVRADLAALDATGVHGRVVEARRATLRAGLAALEGLPTDALVLYRAAFRAWRDLRLPWDEALTAIDMVTLLGPAEPDVAVAAAGAREILVRLGAKPFLDRLDAALAGATPVVSPPSRVDERIDTPSDARLTAR
ncbi:MAG: adenylate/guanylate cyclase domain-containing protein [Candidatus Limnocylindria bacterium]